MPIKPLKLLFLGQEEVAETHATFHALQAIIARDQEISKGYKAAGRTLDKLLSRADKVTKPEASVLVSYLVMGVETSAMIDEARGNPLADKYSRDLQESTINKLCEHFSIDKPVFLSKKEYPG